MWFDAQLDQKILDGIYPIRTTEDDYRPSLSPSGIAPAANCTLWNKISKITAE